MKRSEREFRRKLMLEYEKSQPKKWLWLSFINDDGFAGVIITKANGIIHAIQKTYELGINPGGEIMFCEMEDDDKKFEKCANKLLSREDLASVGFDPISITEAKEQGLINE